MRHEFAVAKTYELDDAGILARLPWRRAADRPHHVSFERFDGGEWHAITAKNFAAAVTTTAKGLIASGVRAGDRVALMAGTRFEWVLLDCAIWGAGGVTVPIYPSSAPAQIEWIVADSGARILLVENAANARLTLDAHLPKGVEVLTIDEGAVDELRRRGEDLPDAVVQEALATLTLDSPASIVYTSGTTARPKGCVLTHRNLLAEVRGILSHPAAEKVAAYGQRTLMFLPLAHVLARAVTYAAWEGGATVGFWGDFGTVTDKFRSFRPTFVLGVPRVFEKVYEGVRANAAKGGPATAEIFRRAEQVAISWSKNLGGDGLGDQRRPGPRHQAEYALFDRLVYGKVRAALGGQCATGISGGGALNPRLAHFFRGLGVPLYEGYGLTETCAAITVNGPGCHRIGSVGIPLGGNSVRIAPSGEIELSGDVVFHEYWKNPDATDAAFDGEWFRTGDIGRLDKDGYLTITGRMKEIIVTAGGKNVVPGPMEDILRQHELVGHAMVVGEGKPFIGALITLDEAGARKWAQENGRDPDDLTALAADPQLRATLQEAVDEASAGVSKAEGIKRFVVLPKDFSEETGELTATLKLKRHVIGAAFADEIESMYS
jgi:long-chain acyl-CoA synthetase